MTTRFLASSSATVVFPRDGSIGSATAIRSPASTGANTTYTANSATDVAAAIPGVGTLVGDYVFTADGFWGVIVSYSGAANNTVITVNVWRSKTTGLVGTPAATNAFTIHSATELTSQQATRIMTITGHGGAQSVTLTDANGSAFIPALVFPAGPPATIFLGEKGIVPNGPFGLIVSAGSASVVYERG